MLPYRDRRAEVVLSIAVFDPWQSKWLPMAIDGILNINKMCMEVKNLPKIDSTKKGHILYLLNKFA